MADQPCVVLITGIMAAGKSTVAQALAERLPRSVHLRGDVFRRMIVNGYVPIDPPISEAALAQLLLRYRQAVAAAQTYCQAGFTVVYQDVMVGSVLGEVVDMLKKAIPAHPIYVVVLCPSVAAVTERDKARHKVAYQSWSPAQLDHLLRAETPRIGYWLDTSSLSIDETVNTILANIQQALT